MPSGYATGLQTNFRYVTVKQVRRAGIPEAGSRFGIEDARLIPLIKEVCLDINRLTDQWFLPARLRERVDGARGAIAAMPNRIPILDFFNLTLEKAGLVSFPYPTLSYQVKPRYVTMITRNTRLPDFPMFVVMDGVFGWLYDETRIIRTKTAAPVNPGDTSIKLTSVAGIRAGDALLIGSAPEPRYEDVVPGTGLQLQSGPVIVDGDPDVPNNTIPVEAVEFVIPNVGVPAVRYGRVPDPIQRAAFLMVRDKVQNVGDVDVDEPPFGIGTRLTGESVEGYSYSLTPAPAVNGFGGGALTTGNVEVDDILTRFAAPVPFIGMA